MEIEKQYQFASEIMRELCVNIGARQTGSYKHKQAEKYITECMTEAGFQTEVQSYTCPAWEFKGLELFDEEGKYPAIVNIYSRPCDVKAKIITASNLSELENKEFTGKILVLHDKLTEQQFVAKNFDIFKIDIQEKAIEFIEAKNPTAIITISQKDEDFPPLIEDSDFKIPSITVSNSTGKEILKKENMEMNLIINSENFTSTSSNIVSRTTFGRKNRVVICAHYDTKYNTPGAVDNATGITAMLLLAKLIDTEKLNVDLEFIAFGSEDNYYPGDLEYFSKNQEYMKNVCLAVNIDGIAMKGQNNAMAFLGENEEVKGKIFSFKDKFEKIEIIEPYFEGDQSFFFFRGIPTISFTSKEIFQYIDKIIHTEKDTFDKVDIERIMEIVDFVKEYLYEIL